MQIFPHFLVYNTEQEALPLQARMALLVIVGHQHGRFSLNCMFIIEKHAHGHFLTISEQVNWYRYHIVPIKIAINRDREW